MHFPILNPRLPADAPRFLYQFGLILYWTGRLLRWVPYLPIPFIWNYQPWYLYLFGAVFLEFRLFGNYWNIIGALICWLPLLGRPLMNCGEYLERTFRPRRRRSLPLQY